MEQDRTRQQFQRPMRSQSSPPSPSSFFRKEVHTSFRDDNHPETSQYSRRTTDAPPFSSVKCPEYFLIGDSSISDSDNNRMYKVKSLFHPAWGPRKFSGKRVPGEEGIISLLTNMNRVQYICPVTEAEFVTLLAQAMTGEAQYAMNDFACRHRLG